MSFSDQTPEDFIKTLCHKDYGSSVIRTPLKSDDNTNGWKGI